MQGLERVLFADRFAEALQATVVDPEVRKIRHRGGAIDATSDNTAFLA